jgi:hypothetical protein
MSQPSKRAVLAVLAVILIVFGATGLLVVYHPPGASLHAN